MENLFDKRPDPDQLLKKYQNEKRRGRLTVFLGAIAGVGKTFAMLKAAHEKAKEGHHIAIGWVETHGRRETADMAEGLFRVPPKTIRYRERELQEMDIDAVLELKPEIVLVDELAHTNIEGSRHVRRYQDVMELLEAGIDVYTTLNIQHIESLNDIVAQITGIVVRETVPDKIMEAADTLQLIDIAPEELLKRLRDGKIYLATQAQQALKGFFRQGNISALRELALRFTAQRVDRDMSQYMDEHKIEGPWPAAERVMVCVSASPFSAQLIRAARRLATGLRSEFLAVHIEEARRRFPVGEKERDRIARNMRMAEELGAKTITVIGENFIDEALEIARKHNITSIVIGKPQHSRLSEMFRGSVVDKMIRRSGKMNVYVIRAGKEQEREPAVKTNENTLQPVARHCLWALMMVAAVTSLCVVFKERLELVNVALLYLIPVLFSAFWWGRWSSYLSAVTGVLCLDFLFVKPTFTFSVNDIHYLWSFAIFLLVSALIGGRTDKMRQEARAARQQEKSTQTIYEFSREIAAVTQLEKIAERLVRQAGENIERQVLIVLPDENGQCNQGLWFDPLKPSAEKLYAAPLSDMEAAVVSWVYKHKQPAGRSTDTLPGGMYLYLPLGGQEKVFGVFGICIGKHKLTPGERRLVDGWTNLAGLAMERGGFAEQARRTDLLIEADKLRNALFNSISHELKTPLSAVIGSVSVLLDSDALLDARDRRDLLTNMKDGALRMERLIVNLLDTARLESGMMKVKLDWCDCGDLVATALRRSEEFRREASFTLEIEEDLPLVRADCALLEQVLVNFIDNAVKYSPAHSKITIQARCKADAVEIAVLDRGRGIPEAEIERIFDKFYRVRQPDKISGTGLGLAICKGIIEAHGGKIYAKNREGGGSFIAFSLTADVVKEVNDHRAKEGDLHDGEKAEDSGH